MIETAASAARKASIEAQLETMATGQAELRTDVRELRNWIFAILIGTIGSLAAAVAALLKG